jgi:hypothetical protein
MSFKESPGFSRGEVQTKPLLLFGLDAKVYHHNEDAINTRGNKE